MAADQKHHSLEDATRAARLVATLTNTLQTPYHGASFMSASIYDTAWVAMVSKSRDGGKDGVSIRDWLFPECFQSILNSQRGDGGFGSGGTEVDGILNTMAATLALCRLKASIPQAKVLLWADPIDLESRISRGKNYLGLALERLDVNAAVHVGFEILVPKLLDLLELQGLEFDFPGLVDLMSLNRLKMSKFKPTVLYSSIQTTLLHSLEAFVGDIDMEKIRHHCRNGSMMASPSSTAAYLMGLDGWDDEAEAYLRFVVRNGNGRVPSAFPTGVFETTWVLSTLFEAGFSMDELGVNNVETLCDFLTRQLNENGNTTGFAPGVLADADDTAKAILCLQLAGRSTPYQEMIEKFETDTHFKTYDFESNESFSANCNVLIALLFSEKIHAYSPQIRKALRFLIARWYTGACNDKWNLEPRYCLMLLAQALSRTLVVWDSDVDFGHAAAEDFEVTMREDVPLVALQILIRTLSSQAEDGSWEHSSEITAYALITLKRLGDLPWWESAGLYSHLKDSIRRAVEFLDQITVKPAFIWVEKVTYGSSVLAEAYCLAAYRLHSPACKEPTRNWEDKVRSLAPSVPPAEKVEGFVRFFSRLPLFCKEPRWRLRASVVEGSMVSPKLQRDIEQINIFPHPTAGDGQKAGYLEYIPLTWTTSNNAADFGISTETVFDMSIISVLNFQVDKYLENITDDDRVLSLGSHGFRKLKNVIHKLKNVDYADHSKSDQAAELSPLLEELEETLSRFMTYVSGHPRISHAAVALRQRLEHQLHVFLEAHLVHGEQNAHMSRCITAPGQEKVFTGANGWGYYEWVRTTSADHTSCPYSFDFFSCLISPPLKSGKIGSKQQQVQDCLFPTPQARYFASDVCRHLATLCRQYNDYGSVKRDHAEGNLNSIDFTEFHSGPVSLANGQKTTLTNANSHTEPLETTCNKDQGYAQRVGDRRRMLMEIAQYERECLDHAVRRLTAVIDGKTAKALRVFVDVTDLYGQIYAVRDINA